MTKKEVKRAPNPADKLISNAMRELGPVRITNRNVAPDGVLATAKELKEMEKERLQQNKEQEEASKQWLEAMREQGGLNVTAASLLHQVNRSTGMVNQQLLKDNVRAQKLANAGARFYDGKVIKGTRQVKNHRGQTVTVNELVDIWDSSLDEVCKD